MQFLSLVERSNYLKNIIKNLKARNVWGNINLVPRLLPLGNMGAFI
jgi:hypothetical protein